jgi:hypothetical protein
VFVRYGEYQNEMGISVKLEVNFSTLECDDLGIVGTAGFVR